MPPRVGLHRQFYTWSVTNVGAESEEGDNNSNVNALSAPSTLTIKPQMKFGVALSNTLWSTAEMGKIRGPDAMGV